DHAGNSDNRITQRGHAAKFRVEFRSAGWADQNDGGQQIIQDRRQEKRAGDNPGTLRQTTLKQCGIAFGCQGCGQLVHTDQLGVQDNGAYQWPARVLADHNADADQARNGSFLDRYITRRQFQQADAASKQNADNPQNGEGIDFAAAFQI